MVAAGDVSVGVAATAGVVVVGATLVVASGEEPVGLCDVVVMPGVTVVAGEVTPGWVAGPVVGVGGAATAPGLVDEAAGSSIGGVPAQAASTDIATMTPTATDREPAGLMSTGRAYEPVRTSGARRIPAGTI